MIDTYLITGLIIGLCYIIFYTKYKGLGELEIQPAIVIAVGLTLIYLVGFLLWPLALLEMIKYYFKSRKEEQL